MAGRPTKFKPEYVNIIKSMCKLGAIVPEIAEALEVAESTVKLWAVKHPEVREAMTLGREEADERVVNSLYMSACGYERDEEEIKVIDGQVVRVPVRKWYPAVPTSMIYWTRNRLRKEWTNAPEAENTDDMSAVLSKLIDKLPS